MGLNNIDKFVNDKQTNLMLEIKTLKVILIQILSKNLLKYALDLRRWKTNFMQREIHETKKDPVITMDRKQSY